MAVTLCDVSWNSHGCGLPDGHDGPLHLCVSWHPTEPCSMIIWSELEQAWERFDHGELVGTVRAFHSRTDADVGRPAEAESRR